MTQDDNCNNELKKQISINNYLIDYTPLILDKKN